MGSSGCWRKNSPPRSALAEAEGNGSVEKACFYGDSPTLLYLRVDLEGRIVAAFFKGPHS
uniref:Uncharacterized protein n=1 Tax=Anguilla anguilla TaxID=7936 RepID=A0A0E9W8N8_ANGAN